MFGPASEAPVTFSCGGDTLVGVVHIPASSPAIGMVIVAGGPQYRTGSHRQFVLLARDLAARDIAVLRFDCRGMGDSGGAFAGFEHIEPDIAAAVDAIFHHVPTLRHVILWGLCDATLAMSVHARRDSRVAGLVLLNPWVRSESGLARAQLKHYYLLRLMQWDFLRKVMRREFDPVASARALLHNIVQAAGAWTRQEGVTENGAAGELAQRMAVELLRFKGRVLIVLSGRDLTAREFEDTARNSKLWQQIYAQAQVTRRYLAAADHTFSRRAWRDQVAEWTWEWLKGSPR